MADTLRDALNDVLAEVENGQNVKGVSMLQTVLQLLDKAAEAGLEIMVEPESEALYVSLSLDMPEWLKPGHKTYRPGYEWEDECQ